MHSVKGKPTPIAPVLRGHHRLVSIVALLMILFGLAEVVTGFSHNFLGIHIADVTSASYAGAAIGLLYATAGLLVLTRNKRAVALAVALLFVVISGRIAMVVTGLYPTDSFKQTGSIILGTSIVVAFAIYILLRWSDFWET